VQSKVEVSKQSIQELSQCMQSLPVPFVATELDEYFGGHSGMQVAVLPPKGSNKY